MSARLNNESCTGTSRVDSIDDYDALVTASPQGSIYCRRWWLDTVAPGAYEILELRKGSELRAAWPLVFRYRRGERCIQMPQLTQKLGVLFPEIEGKAAEVLSTQHTIAEDLIARLPECAKFTHKFHEAFTNWLPFAWHGFLQTTRYTYLIDDLSDESATWAGMRASCRKNIRKATKNGLRVIDDLPLDRFIAVQDSTYERQGAETPIDRDLIVRLHERCRDRGCCQIFAAVDSSDRVHAGAFLVWDNGVAYYLMGGADSKLRQSGGQKLALWEAIRFSATVANVFDFEGSMIRTIEANCRGFGARQVPYFQISKKNVPEPHTRSGPGRLASGLLRRIAGHIDRPG